MKKNRYVRVISLCLALFFVGIALLSYIARSVYLENLPYIQKTEAISGKLSKTFVLTGTVVADTNLQRSVYAPADLRITKVMAEGGDSVLVGSELIMVNVEELELTLLRMQLEALELARRGEELREELEDAKEEEDRARFTLYIRENEISLERLDKDIAAAEAILRRDGVITSTGCDLVYILPENMGYVSRGTLLASYIPFPSQKQLEFSIAKTQRHILPIGTLVYMDVTVLDPQTGEYMTESVKLPITGSTDVGDSWLYTVDLPVQHLYMHHGEKVEIDTTYVSKAQYDYVIPRTAIQLDETGRSGDIFLVLERERVYGAEHYLRRATVQVRAYDDVHVVLQTDPGAAVALYAKGLEDGAVVRLW